MTNPLIAKIPKEHNDHLDFIESLIDQHGLSYVATLLAEVCSAKADHIEENWQDAPLAQLWNEAASGLLTDVEIRFKYIS